MNIHFAMPTVRISSETQAAWGLSSDRVRISLILARSAGGKGLPRPQLGHAARSAGDNGLPRPQLGLRAKRRRQGACPVIGLGLVLINFYWISLRCREEKGARGLRRAQAHSWPTGALPEIAKHAACTFRTPKQKVT
jgi:hypothetical protein